jgi:hypothetical protein
MMAERRSRLRFSLMTVLPEIWSSTPCSVGVPTGVMAGTCFMLIDLLKTGADRRRHRLSGADIRDDYHGIDGTIIGSEFSRQTLCL